MPQLIAQLGHQDFKKREEAHKRLFDLGPPAHAPLLRAQKDATPEIATRARSCADAIRKAWNIWVPRAAVRRLLQLKPKDSAQALVRFLPYAADKELEEEIWGKIKGVGSRLRAFRFETTPDPFVFSVFFHCGMFIATAVSPSPSRGEAPFRVEESKSVTVNDARFVTVIQTDWIAVRRDDAPGRMPIETQLRITNLKKNAAAFLVSYKFGITIKREDGSDVAPKRGGDTPVNQRPIIIAPGASYSLTRVAVLSFEGQTDASTLIYKDGTGDWITYGPLKSGKYKLSFWYSTTRVKSGDLPTHIGDVPLWTGDAQTPEVTFEVINSTVTVPLNRL